MGAVTCLILWNLSNCEIGVFPRFWSLAFIMDQAICLDIIVLLVAFLCDFVNKITCLGAKFPISSILKINYWYLLYEENLCSLQLILAFFFIQYWFKILILTNVYVLYTIQKLITVPCAPPWLQMMSSPCRDDGNAFRTTDLFNGHHKTQWIIAMQLHVLISCHVQNSCEWLKPAVFTATLYLAHSRSLFSYRSHIDVRYRLCHKRACKCPSTKCW